MSAAHPGGALFFAHVANRTEAPPFGESSSARGREELENQNALCDFVTVGDLQPVVK
jgi:hypothetical protein